MICSRSALLAAIAAIALALSACGREAATPTLQHALFADPPVLVGEFILTDQHNAPFTRADLLGRWTLLFSGFTHCPDICPATLGILRAAQSDLEARDDLQTVLVTVDPARDTPAQLAEYLAWFDEDWIGLTGETKELNRLLEPLQMAYVRVPTGGGEYTMDHASAVALIDPRGQLIAWWRAPIEAAALAQDLRGLPVQ
ncbi:MAG: SCO family protein [Xanthomonadales bacterium]|nr:SCO family protein [Xanthomonadales bacterium]